MLIVNGKEKSWFEGMTVFNLLEELEINPDTVVIELNRSQIVPKTDFAATSLQDGDHIEIISFVGGG